MIVEKLDIGDLGFPENPPCPICDVALATKLPDKGPINRFKCDKHGDFALVVLLVPEGVLAFLNDAKACIGDIRSYLEYSIIKKVEADLDAGDPFTPDAKEVKETYSLENVLDC